MIDWDDAYANGSYIADAASYPPKWANNAARYRKAEFAELDIRYGPHTREKLDIFWPEATPKGLAVFVHGGYWMQFDKSSWSNLAEGARRNGWAVVVPSYALAPEVRINEITRQIGRAITIASERIAGPIRLAGHSAGGHLVAQMACRNGPLKDVVADRLEHVLSISGLHDMRPLLNTKMNETLQMTDHEALEQSACLSMPRDGVKVTTWVGSDERPEFLRQSRILADIWGGLGVDTTLKVQEGFHHFNVIETLADPNSEIAQAFGGAK